MSRTNNITSLGMNRTLLMKGLGGLAIGTAMALAVPAVSSAHSYDDSNIAQGDVYTTDGTVAPAAYSTSDSNGDITVTSPQRSDRSDLNASNASTYSRDYVSINDLDLNSQYGRDRLMDRVSLAAKDACQRVDDQSSLDEPYAGTSSNDCYHQAMSDSRPQVDDAIDQATPVAYIDHSSAGATYDNASYTPVSYTPATAGYDNGVSDSTVYDDGNTAD